jgi:hypothetical protein
LKKKYGTNIIKFCFLETHSFGGVEIKLIEFYCETELEGFQKSKFYQVIDSICKEKGFFPQLIYGQDQSSKRTNLYLSISILDEKKQIVNIYDDGFLTSSTKLVTTDKKGRYMFYRWQDDKEFLDDLLWIKSHLKKL